VITIRTPDPCSFGGTLDVREEIHDTVGVVLDDVPLTLHAVPRPVDRIAQSLGYHIHVVSDEELDKYHGWLANEIIYVGAGDKPWQRRFTIAHELGHAMLWSGADEWECSAFAEALLIPRSDLVAVVHHGWAGPMTLCDWAEAECIMAAVTVLVRRYAIGYNAMIRALGNYGLILDVPPWRARFAGDDLFAAYRAHYERIRRAYRLPSASPLWGWEAVRKRVIPLVRHSGILPAYEHAG
jgi:hypothetical protein